MCKDTPQSRRYYASFQNKFMPLFHYKVLNKEQKTVEGQMESKDRFALYHTLKQDGSIVIYVEEITEELKK